MPWRGRRSLERAGFQDYADAELDESFLACLKDPDFRQQMWRLLIAKEDALSGCPALRPLNVSGTAGLLRLRRSLFSPQTGRVPFFPTRRNPALKGSFLRLPFSTSYGYTMYIMAWEWDDAKNTANSKKHGVSFEEALQVFTDPKGIEKEDLAHSRPKERRLWRTGKMRSGRIVTVVYTLQGDNIRLISAQERRRERREYEETNKETKE